MTHLSLETPARLALPQNALLALLSQSRDLLAVTDRQGRIVWANEAFQKTTGLPSEQQRSLLALLRPASSGDASRHLIAKALSGESLHGKDFSFITESGKTLFGRVNASEVDGQIIWTLQEVSTERQPALAPVELPNTPDGSYRLFPSNGSSLAGKPGTQQILEFDVLADSGNASRLLQRLEIAAAAAGMGVWCRDPLTDKAEWNEQMFYLMGQPPEAAPPAWQAFIGLVHPEDRHKLDRARQLQLNIVEGAVENEYRVVLPSGEVRWLLDRARSELWGGRKLVFGVTIDLTERRRTEAALRHANGRAALAARGAGIGTWEYDLTTGESYWDEQMYLLRGLQPDCGRTPKELKPALAHPEEVENVQASLQRSIVTGEMSSYEFRVLMPDGTYRWLASRSMPVYDEAGKPIRQIGVNWDIHEHRNAENAQRDKALAQLESAAKSELLSRISHELRTPLNAVLGFTQLLEAHFEKLDKNGSEERIKLGHIRSASEHLLALIDDILDLSDLETGQLRLEMKPVELASSVQNAILMAQAFADRKQVQVQCSQLNCSVIADDMRLRQVLVNLLTHAIDHSNAGDKVLIEAKLDGAQAVLAIRDQGRGLNEGQRSLLFEPFGRPPSGVEPEESTGIGLAIVKALVKHMGGELLVDSQTKSGVTVTVRLALAQAPQKNSASPPADTRKVRCEGSGQLLYIEDNPVNVLVVEELLAQRSNLNVVSESSGAMGVARAKTMKPDLILIDIQLPDFNGFEVLKRLKADPSTAKIPCVALSANATQDDITRAMAAGFTDYWTKPIDFNAFVAALALYFPVAGPSG